MPWVKIPSIQGKTVSLLCRVGAGRGSCSKTLSMADFLRRIVLALLAGLSVSLQFNSKIVAEWMSLLFFIISHTNLQYRGNHSLKHEKQLV